MILILMYYIRKCVQRIACFKEWEDAIEQAKKVRTSRISLYSSVEPLKKGKYDGIYDKDIYERSVEFLKPYEGKIFTETDKNSFINAVYDTEQIKKKTAYYEEIEKNIEKFKETGVVEYTLDDANEDFRGIHSVTVMPDSIYNKNNELIDGIDTFLKIPNLHKGVRKNTESKDYFAYLRSKFNK